MALLRSEIMHANPRTCLIWWTARFGKLSSEYLTGQAKWINREPLWGVLWAALESRLFQAAAPGGGGSPLSCMQISSWVISGALWTSSHVHTYLCKKAKNTGGIMLEALEVIKLGLSMFPMRCDIPLLGRTKWKYERKIARFVRLTREALEKSSLLCNYATLVLQRLVEKPEK